MGCLKLSYYQTYSNRKVLYSDSVLEPKSAQMWLSVDPMSDKYPSMSPYNYCANNPVIFVDPDGKEKIHLFSTTDGRTPGLIKAMNNFPDNPNVIHIWVHGFKYGVEAYNSANVKIWIFNEYIFQNILEENSSIWRENHQNGENNFTIIVLHSCNTGNEEDGIYSFARNMSKGLPNTLIVAPTGYVYAPENGDKQGSYKGYEDADGKVYFTRVGAWSMFLNGEKVNAFYGLTLPIFNNPDLIEQQYNSAAKADPINKENSTLHSSSTF